MLRSWRDATDPAIYEAGSKIQIARLCNVPESTYDGFARLL